jgi:hypothetical protein
MALMFGVIRAAGLNPERIYTPASIGIIHRVRPVKVSPSATKDPTDSCQYAKTIIQAEEGVSVVPSKAHEVSA